MFKKSAQTTFAAGFVRGVLSISIGTLLQIILGLTGLMVAVRFIPSEQFGVFVLMQVIASFFVALGNLAVQDVSVTKYIVDAADDQRFVVASTALWFNFIIGLLISLTIIICKPVIIYLFESDKLSELVMYIPIFFLLNSFSELLMYIVQGFQQYKIIAISQLINGLVKFILILVFLIYLGMGLIGLIYAFYFSFAASILILYFGIPSRERIGVSRRLFLEILKFGFPLGLNRLLSFGFSKLDRLILGSMVSTAGVAYYEVASRIPENGYRLFQSFHSVFFPNIAGLIAEKDKLGAERLVNNSLRVITFVSSFVALIVLLFKEDIVRLLFSEQYIESANSLWVLTVALIIGFIEYTLGGVLIALGEPDKPVKINIVSALANVIGNIIMIPRFGIVGAACANLLSHVLVNPTYVLFVRKYGVQINLGKYVIPIAILGACGGVYMIYESVNVGFKVSLILIFMGLCFAFSVITRGDISVLLRAVGRRP